MMTPYVRPSGSPVLVSEIAARLGGTLLHGDAEVLSVTANSRDVRPGDLFAALPGAHVHGARFAAQAIEAGACAVLTDAEGAEACAANVGGATVPLVVMDESAARMGEVASLIYGNPAASISSFAVTGTNGKTTTAYMIESIMRALGRSCGLIGTVEVRLAGTQVPARMTTPMPDELQAYLAFHRDGGGDTLAMEVSSHALIQRRSDPLVFDVAGFTNLTQDHLDFHETMEEYYLAKAQLFDARRSRAGVVIVNDEWGVRLVKEKACEIPLVALAINADLPDLPAGVRAWTARGESSRFVLESSEGERLVTSTMLPGDFNVANAALAAVMAMTAGYSADELSRAIPEGINPSVPGRMEVLSASPRVVVDFAHNTEALVKAMEALRPSTRGRLITLMGAAGERDKGKRPAMGRAVAMYSDRVYITDDDPHGEDPAAIRAAVLEGTRGLAAEVIEIADRREAIAAAILEADPQDTVLLAGRGHETIQEVAGVEIALDDRVEARAALAARNDGNDEEGDSL